ncbi:thioesterase II family protein [Sphaerisporangium corydalis]|uniref:Thioesterase II family protein n=1 Tax=Sphaerisporangium corydalis TaxID=1441875 RepID=A0ABV9ECL3_9ACTN|nr:alpha/beta fold hydrolase [Sphaerisporangium corydalis]
MAAQRIQDTTVIRPSPRPAATRSLVCLGFCGGGTGAYRPWAAHLDDRTELTLICYPGREGRFAEAPARSWEELADDATAAVLSAAGRPYVLFGHSMGGWMAFEVATRIERSGGPVPEALVVSSCNAPDRGLTERDRFPSFGDTDEALLSWMRTIGLLPDHVRSDPDLMDMAYELMRADIRVRDSYTAPGARTRIPVRVLYGRDDEVIEPGVAGQWAGVCDGPCRVDALPGGHFYTPDVWRALPAHIDVL